MTDKQIIIDVSKCKECGLRNCEGNFIYWCHTYDDHCQDFDNCYYKQLKQAEQKLEKIKEICKNVMPTGIDEETDKFGDILEIIEE